MALSPRTVSIVIALLLSGSFIALGYYLSSPFSPRFADAASTQELLKEYAEKDSDADGLPDWQEELYGTDPQKGESVQAGVSDKEAVDRGLVTLKFASEKPSAPSVTEEDIPGESPKAGTLSEEFGIAFAESVLAAGGTAALSPENQAAIVSRLVAEFSVKAEALVTSSYTASSIRSSSSVTTDAYVDDIERVFAKHGVREEIGELITLSKRYVEDGDTMAQPGIARIGVTFKALAVDLAGIESPAYFKNDHLLLVQSFDMLGTVATLIANYEEDPVAALGAVGAYKTGAINVVNVWVRLGKRIASEGGQYAPESLSAIMVEFSRTHQEL